MKKGGMSYVKRMEQFKQLLDTHATVGEMMAATGLAQSSVEVYSGQARRRFNGVVQRARREPPRLPHDVARAIATEARRRDRMASALLVKALLTVIARDNLFSAILDE